MDNTNIFSTRNEQTDTGRDALIRLNNTNSTDDVTIQIPDSQFKYYENDVVDKDNNTENEDGVKQYLITSNESINKSLSKDSKDNEEYSDYFLNYSKSDNSIKWKGSRATGTITGVESNSRKTIPIEDFSTNVQFGILGRTHEDSATAVNKHTWVSLHASVSDIGLKQATWNINEEYYSIHLPNATLENKPLYVRFAISNDEDATNLRFTIKYLLVDSDSIQITNNLQLGSKDGDKFPITTDGTTTLDVFKVLSVEITAYASGTTVNQGNLEFFLINTNSDTGDTESGLTKLTMTVNDTEFDYNEDFTDCQFTNQYYNRNLWRSTEHEIDFTKDQITAETTGTGAQMYTHIKDTYDGVNGSGSFENLFTSNILVLELEGGTGRKGQITINNTNTSLNTTFKITNPGYLYTQNDVLRIKDHKLRNIVNLTAKTVGDSSENETEQVQEVIRYSHGKSNTIKYALGKKEKFVIKNLTVCGSVKSDVIVKLIHLKNIFSTSPRQYILKEMVYYSRTNIQESHDLNIFIDNESSTIGNEFYIELQKIVKNSNDNSRDDSLNFI